MAVVQELVAKLGFQVDQAGLQKADNGLKSMAQSAALMYGAYRAAAGAFGLIVDSVKAAANLESLNAEFEVLLKNAEAAKYLTQQIQQFAAETPFETEGLARGAKTMMAFGMSANEAMQALRFIGDIAGADQERMNRMIMTYSQVVSLGRLQGDNLREFAIAGFNPLEELSRKTGKSMAELRKEMEKGKITADMVTEAFMAATGPGGKFFGNMEKQSKTLVGLWSTLRDNFRMMMAELGGQLVPMIKDVVTNLITMTESIAGAYRQLADFFAIMFDGGPEAIDVAAGIAAAFGTIADAIMLMATALQGVWTIAEMFGTAFATMLGGIVDLVMLVPKSFGYAAKGLASLVIGAGKLTGNQEMIAYGAQQKAEAEGLIGGGLFANSTGQFSMGVDRASASAAKTAQLWSMIGGSKDAAAGSKQALTDSVLKALQGNGKTITNNFTTNTTIHAEGSMKDILTEQANSILGLGLQARLIAATV